MYRDGPLMDTLTLYKSGGEGEDSAHHIDWVAPNKILWLQLWYSKRKHRQKLIVMYYTANVTPIESAGNPRVAKWSL